MSRNDTQGDHGDFEKLCALAQTNSLSVDEQLELDAHLSKCSSCQAVYAEFSVIGEVGMALLSAEYSSDAEGTGWNSSEALASLLESAFSQGPCKVIPIKPSTPRGTWRVFLSTLQWRMALYATAVCGLVATALLSYHLGKRQGFVSARQMPAHRSSDSSYRPEQLATVTAIPLDNLSAQTNTLAKLKEKLSNAQEEVAELQAKSLLAAQRYDDLAGIKDGQETHLSELSDQRDRLINQLTEARAAYSTLQTEYSTLRSEHDRNLLHIASVESELTDLREIGVDQQRKLKDYDQYLASDRDIRELMGARKLYIADVFDVDSVSHTRKPFGRVFYTQSKSLVFYAFDLDHQAAVKTAGVFQVWGQRDAEASSAPHPMNLGILYMDSESNRRWVFRSDDPKQLADIDAVFVTVEPHIGSPKPSGKPLLYALLRKEANHP
jgi:hypothetical protein